MLKKPLEVSEPLSLIEKRAFMKLPIEKRREIMAQQAARIAAHFRTERPWGDLPEEDFLDE
jgi:hypothetical protein